MKTTGITRRFDDLGRIVIPREIRRTLRLHEGDAMEMCLTEEGNLLLRKHSNGKAIDRELRAAIAVLQERWPSVKFVAFDKDGEPITNEWRTSLLNDLAQLARDASVARAELSRTSEDGCALAAIPIVVDDEPWAILVGAGYANVPAEEFETAIDTARALCKFMENVFD